MKAPAKFVAVVVFPLPPFLFATAMMVAISARYPQSTVEME